MKKAIISGILVLISISPIFRGLYFSYDTYAFLTGIALFSVLYFTFKLLKNEPVHINKFLALCGVILVCSSALSFVKALNPRENLDTVLLYLELTVISLVLYDFFHDNKETFIKWLMIPASTVGFICSLVGLTGLSGYRIWEVTTAYGRIGSTFQYANTAAVYFLICLLFAITLTDAVGNMLLKALFSGMGSVTMFALFMTGSRGGYLVGVAVIVLLLLLQPHGHRIRGGIGFICMLAPVFAIIKGFNKSTGSGDLTGTVLWLAALFFIAAALSLLVNFIFRLMTKDKEYMSPKGTGYVFAAAAVIVTGLSIAFRDRLVKLVPPYISERMVSLFMQGFYEKNVLYRIEYNKDALKLIPQNWLFGTGGGGWKAIYQSVQDFFYTAVFVHNNYLQVFLESGIFGFISFIALVLVSLCNAMRFYAHSVDSKLRTYCAGLLCALIALAGHSACDFDLSYASMLLLLWSMITAASVGISTKGSTPAAAAGVEKHGRSTDATVGRYAVTVMTIACSALLTINALHFTAAQNAQTAFDYGQEKDYRLSMAYYEEAGRLDAANTKYSFELAKLYRYFADKSGEETERESWLEKARAAAEKSVAGAKHYPAYMNTLVRIYLDSGTPLEALKYSQELVANQKYYAENYELLAKSYLAAADYYLANGDTEKAEELLSKCIGISNDPYLKRSVIDMPDEIGSEQVISGYKPSENLSKCLKDAETKLYKVNSK
jgi:O-antigen ligase